MQLTDHARRRSSQRNIPTNIIATICAYGAELKAPGGARKVLLDRGSIELAADGNARKRSELERYLQAYLVIGDDGRVITVARQRRRFFK
ncbi:hypothetical protein IB277_26555 [Ensifer sp. ENS07]|uniref:hypothetical protein n=1 Tax=Ensifer sp. ENS07 TaxID=2769274 RepID=UPI0017800C52|nr:hypothetical protein [Ensifer sp. ENS07]MBD9639859.1 hypothetical protein [Ensifer sp. ENS07]